MQDVRRRYAHMLRATVHKVLCRGSPHTQSQTPLVFVLAPVLAACKNANAQPLHCPMQWCPSP